MWGDSPWRDRLGILQGDPPRDPPQGGRPGVPPRGSTGRPLGDPPGDPPWPGKWKYLCVHSERLLTRWAKTAADKADKERDDNAKAQLNLAKKRFQVMESASTLVSAWKAKKTVAMGVAKFHQDWELLTLSASQEPVVELRNGFIWDLFFEVTGMRCFDTHVNVDNEIKFSHLNRVYPNGADVEEVQTQCAYLWISHAISNANTKDIAKEACVRLTQNCISLGSDEMSARVQKDLRTLHILVSHPQLTMDEDVYKDVGNALRQVQDQKSCMEGILAALIEFPKIGGKLIRDQELVLASFNGFRDYYNALQSERAASAKTDCTLADDVSNHYRVMMQLTDSADYHKALKHDQPILVETIAGDLANALHRLTKEVFCCWLVTMKHLATASSTPQDLDLKMFQETAKLEEYVAPLGIDVGKRIHMWAKHVTENKLDSTVLQKPPPTGAVLSEMLEYCDGLEWLQPAAQTTGKQHVIEDAAFVKNWVMTELRVHYAQAEVEAFAKPMGVAVAMLEKCLQFIKDGDATGFDSFREFECAAVALETGVTGSIEARRRSFCRAKQGGGGRRRRKKRRSLGRRRWWRTRTTAGLLRRII